MLKESAHIPGWHRQPDRSTPGGLFLLLAAAMIVAGTPIRAVTAQSPGRHQVEDTLERARALYEELLPVARQLGDQGILQRMNTLRAQWVAARGHFQAGRMTQAQTMARRNYDQLRQLRTEVQRLAQRLPYYGRLEERNRELLEFMREEIGPGAPPEVTRRLTLAAGAHQRARQARQRGNLLQAFRLMEQSENLIRQVLRYIDRTGLTTESVRRELDETARRIERLAGDPELLEVAREALERAREAQEEAERFFTAGELRQALAATLTARTAVRLATRLSTGAITPEDVATAIAHTTELMEMHGTLASSSEPGVRRLWNEAGEHLVQARTHLENGQLRTGLAEAQTAAKLVLTAVRRAGSGAPPPPPATS